MAKNKVVICSKFITFAVTKTTLIFMPRLFLVIKN